MIQFGENIHYSNICFEYSSKITGKKLDIVKGGVTSFENKAGKVAILYFSCLSLTCAITSSSQRYENESISE